MYGLGFVFVVMRGMETCM